MTCRHCGDPVEPFEGGWIHSPGVGLDCTNPEPKGRPRGGLSRIARALELDTAAGIFWNLAGAAIGVGAGWLFAALWIR